MAERRELLIERKDNHSSDSGGCEKFNLLAIAEDGVWFATGSQGRVRVTIKRDHGGLCLAGHREKLVYDLPVSTMDSVKFPNSDRATLPITRERIEPVIDRDRTHDTAFFPSHHKPTIGKMRGINRYPNPNCDHTV